jgi:polyisoprenyl-phosphate glycosyltransferase
MSTTTTAELSSADAVMVRVETHRERPVTGPAPELSIVIPIYNEEDTIAELHRRLLSVAAALNTSFEIIFVNDGSSDRSLEMLRETSTTNPQIKIIDLSRNFGHQAALLAGLSRASGQAIVMMDGDLQDPPELIPDLVALWRSGFDVVYAVRKNRKENLLMRGAYFVYYRVLQAVSYVPIPVDSGDFSLMDGRVARVIRGMPERNKFLRGLRAWAGFKQTRVEYDRPGRYAGETKYSFSKLVRLAFDGLIAYSYMPLRVAYLMGLLVSAGSFVLAIVYMLQRLFSAQPIPQGFTTLAVLMLFLGGVQLVCLGVLGEYIGRIYEEVKARPSYLEREAIGFDGE